MEKGYAGQGTQLGTFFIGLVAASIALTSVFSDWSNAQLASTPDAIIEAEPPAAIPAAESSGPVPATPAPPSPSETAENQLKDMVQAWRDAWASRNTEAYLAFYTDDFQGGVETPDKWRANRKRIIGQAKFIDIQLGQTEITLRDADSATVAFTLDYTSDRFKDHGTKLLEVRREGEKWLIEGETFAAN